MLYKQVNSKDLLYSTGNYIVSCNKQLEKNLKKKWIYITFYTSETNYILQFKKNKTKNEVRYPNEEKFTLFITFNEKVKSLIFF